MNDLIYQKAKENYIKEGYQRLADIEATREWSKSETIPLPKFTKPSKIPFSAGLYNFILQLRP